MATERTGSTRIMRAVEPGVIALQYTDRWSAFDRGSSPQLISGIGVSRCACAVKSFKLAHQAGLRTHFIEQIDYSTIHVQEFSVPGQESLSGKVHGRVLPLEWVWRMLAKGSLLERINSGEIDPTALGFPPNTKVTDGMKLPRMILECTTKFEVIDRHLNIADAMELAGISDEQFENVWLLFEKIVQVTNKRYESVGFIVPDGKGEAGMTPEGELVQVDVFGTQDENRIIDAVTGELYSKDLIRNYLKELPWKRELDMAKVAYRNEKLKWPPYPILPPPLVELVSERYAEAALRYDAAQI